MIAQTTTPNKAEIFTELVLSFLVADGFLVVIMSAHFKMTVSIFIEILSNFHLASQELYPERFTETSISVSYTPEAGVIGSQMVARNAKVGRFLGTCDTRTCTVSGLSAGFIYDIWVRTCSGSGPKRCILRAAPARMVTYPRGKISSRANRMSASTMKTASLFFSFKPRKQLKSFPKRIPQ